MLPLEASGRVLPAPSSIWESRLGGAHGRRPPALASPPHGLPPSPCASYKDISHWTHTLILSFPPPHGQDLTSKQGHSQRLRVDMNGGHDSLHLLTLEAATQTFPHCPVTSSELEGLACCYLGQPSPVCWTPHLSWGPALAMSFPERWNVLDILTTGSVQRQWSWGDGGNTTSAHAQGWEWSVLSANPNPRGLGIVREWVGEGEHGLGTEIFPAQGHWAGSGQRGPSTPSASGLCSSAGVFPLAQLHDQMSQPGAYGRHVSSHGGLWGLKAQD